MRYLLCTLLFLVTAASAVTLEGKVVGVHDGDTFTLLTKNNEQKKIRLQHVDAPETNQPFSSRSKQALSMLVYGKIVHADCPYRSYNRYVCDVTVNGRDVQAELVKAGMVWVSKRYNKRPELCAYLKRAQGQKKVSGRCRLRNGYLRGIGGGAGGKNKHYLICKSRRVVVC